ncbi:MAG: hypothetical protein WCW44_00645 [archaeon]|jgi:hypothetical protein
MKKISKGARGIRGFGGFLLVLAIFIAAVFLLSINTQTEEANSMKEQIVQSKIVLTNYEINLKQATMDCNWSRPLDLNTCIEAKANTLLTKENTIQNFLTCSKMGNTLTITQGSKYSLDLNCTNKPATFQKDLIIVLQKTITITKPQ